MILYNPETDTLTIRLEAITLKNKVYIDEQEMTLQMANLPDAYSSGWMMTRVNDALSHPGIWR